jgi:phage shock protein A
MGKNTNSWWSRFWGMFNAKAHKALDKVKDTEMKIDLIKQKTRELETSHKSAVLGLSQVKALEIKYNKAVEKAENSSKSYGEKADKLRIRFESASDADKPQYKSDIILMLNKKETMDNEAKTQIGLALSQKSRVDTMTSKIKSLAKLIKSTKNSIINMEAQAQAAKVNKEVSSELSDMNFDGVTGQINDLQTDIDSDNAEAEAWEDMGTSLESDEKRIEKMLDESSPTEDTDLFNSFMDKK